jgi:hypothetical protein
VNDVIVKRDSDHVTGTFARKMAEGVRTLLRQANVLS